MKGAFWLKEVSLVVNLVLTWPSMLVLLEINLKSCGRESGKAWILEYIVLDTRKRNNKFWKIFLRCDIELISTLGEWKRRYRTVSLSNSPGGRAGALQTDSLMYLPSRVYWIGAQVWDGCLWKEVTSAKYGLCFSETCVRSEEECGFLADSYCCCK